MTRCDSVASNSYRRSNSSATILQMKEMTMRFLRKGRKSASPHSRMDGGGVGGAAEVIGGLGQSASMTAGEPSPQRIEGNANQEALVNPRTADAIALGYLSSRQERWNSLSGRGSCVPQPAFPPPCLRPKAIDQACLC